jgi:hypothetical protein
LNSSERRGREQPLWDDKSCDNSGYPIEVLRAQATYQS